MTCQLQNFTVEIVGLLLDGLTCLKQRPDHRDQLGTILDQLLGPHSKNIELGTADHETDVLEQATDLVLEIALEAQSLRLRARKKSGDLTTAIVPAGTSFPAAVLREPFDLVIARYAIILTGPTVLSAVGTCPPHDGVRRRWWINVATMR